MGKPYKEPVPITIFDLIQRLRNILEDYGDMDIMVMNDGSEYGTNSYAFDVEIQEYEGTKKAVII